MKTNPVFHGMLSIERVWAAPPDRVFKAWSDLELKSQWFRGPPEQWTETRRSMDFRVGGLEVAEGRFDSEMTTLFEARYHVIAPSHRLVFVYDLHLSGECHSVTLASLDLQKDGGKTHVSYTEQIVFLDGLDGVEHRRSGTEVAFEAIERLCV